MYSVCKVIAIMMLELNVLETMNKMENPFSRVLSNDSVNC
jgi:hypothetical protein